LLQFHDKRENKNSHNNNNNATQLEKKVVDVDLSPPHSPPPKAQLVEEPIRKVEVETPEVQVETLPDTRPYKMRVYSENGVKFVRNFVFFFLWLSIYFCRRGSNCLRKHWKEKRN
jgi:hypothetical protein